MVIKKNDDNHFVKERTPFSQSPVNMIDLVNIIRTKSNATTIRNTILKKPENGLFSQPSEQRKGSASKVFFGTGSTQLIDCGIDLSSEENGGMVWIKSLSEGTTSYNGDHFVFDSIRGVTNHLKFNTSGQQNVTSNSLSAFNSNGFTIGNLPDINKSGDKFVSFVFNTTKKFNETSNQSKTYINHSNDQSGFAMIKFIGSELTEHALEHKLGFKPKLVMTKAINQTSGWKIYSSDFGIQKTFNLDSLPATDEVIFSAEPSDTHIFLNDNTDVNKLDEEFIAYIWTDAPSFMKTQIGSGNVDLGIDMTQPESRAILKNVEGGDFFVVDNANGNNKTISMNTNKEQLEATRIEFTTNGINILDGNTYLIQATGSDYRSIMNQKSITINGGLGLTFADGNTTTGQINIEKYISNDSVEDISLLEPLTKYHVYRDLSNNKYGMTSENCHFADTRKQSGYFYNYMTGEMFSPVDNKVNLVFIGEFSVDGNGYVVQDSIVEYETQQDYRQDAEIGDTSIFESTLNY